MVDPQAVDAGRRATSSSTLRVGDLEHLRVLLAHADEVVDVEEPPVAAGLPDRCRRTALRSAVAHHRFSSPAPCDWGRSRAGFPSPRPAAARARAAAARRRARPRPAWDRSRRSRASSRARACRAGDRYRWLTPSSRRYGHEPAHASKSRSGAELQPVGRAKLHQPASATPRPPRRSVAAASTERATTGTSVARGEVTLAALGVRLGGRQLERPRGAERGGSAAGMRRSS